ncbi:MAG: hypothetical protein ABJL44_18480 [Algibacter sp.]
MKKSKFSHKVIAVFLTLNFLTTIIPVNYLFANNNGPNAPEASGFEPVDATDMVSLSTGDSAYVLPLIDVGGFPVTLSYHSGIPLDMESSWVGLGWNINTGAIVRGVSATPDDWNAAKTLDFIYFQNSETFYSINVGIGISKAAEVGVGMSWGSNKSLSGSVFGNLGPVSASISTDGSYSVGFGVGFGSDPSKASGVGGSVSISGNINGGKPTYGLGVGGRTGNLTGSLGVSLSDSGASFSISGGYSNRKSGGGKTTGQSASGGISVGNYSSGDYDISSKGFYIPLQLGPFSLGFGKQKVTYTLKKGYEKTGYGTLYANLAASNDLSINSENISTNHRFDDYQNRYVYADMYEQVLPQTEGEFIVDSQAENMKLNFSFAGYDSYEVNATGVAGAMKPKIFENATLFGLGYKGAYPDSNSEEKMRIYNHNSKGTSSTSYLPTKSLGGANNFVFYFDGHFTQDTEVGNLNYTNGFSFNTSSLKTMKDYLPTGRTIDNNRKKSGNYVEVFTNYQIRTGQANGLLEPEGLPHDSRTNLDYKDSGIGGYKITAPDGKIYHFSLPVYNYERVERTNLQDSSGDYVNEKRQYTPFATHWLLTAITGPDFVDINNDNFPDENDYGYWVRLDHGKWSNSYTWRSPYSGVNYNTNELGKIGTDDFGNYQYGRKDLYYLDKIVSQTHTAYFVKDIRYDATGAIGSTKESDPSYTDKFVYKFTKTTTIPDDTDDPNGTSDPYVYEEGITYKREYQLHLDKIVIVPNQFSTVSKSQSSQTLNSQSLPGYIANDSYQLQYNTHQDAGFYAERGARPTVYMHQEDMVYDVNDFVSFDYSQAIKTIQFGYNYELAEQSPSSFLCNKNTNKGRLALKQVEFLGRNMVQYMPAYKFDYKNKGATGSGLDYPVGHTSVDVNGLANKAKDDWGFIDEQYYLKEYLKNTHNSEPGDSNYKTLFNQYYTQYADSYGPDNWSLNKITTPTGSTINFEYEEDDYYSEAFSRRYWVDNIKFKFRSSGGVYYIDIENDTPNILSEYMTEDFTDYFKVGDNPFIDFSFCGRSRESGALHDIDKYQFSINSKELEVNSVSSSQLVLKVLSSQISFGDTDSESNPFNDNDWYSYTQGTNYVVSEMRKGKGACPSSPGGGWDRHSIYYKLLASKVPQDQTGGGLRMKSITLEDENSNKYHTKYYYNQPDTYKEKDVGTYKSSGITSFAPVNGLKFVPYQSELPGAGVMYEYVTMVSESDQGVTLGETRYRFHTLQPVMDIFDPNLTMYDDEGTKIFNATVTHANNHSEGLLHSDQKVYAKKINLDVNTSLVGQFRSTEEFNNEGHSLKKTEKKYLSGSELASYANRGYVKESFQNMKSIFKANSDNNNPVLQKRLLSLSSRRDYNSVLSSVSTTTQFGKTTETYSNADPETGAFRTTETEMYDGTKLRVDKIPAYTKYPSMGSKVSNDNYKHMLTQEAMVISKIDINNVWKTTNASITAWSDDWTYRDDFGVEPTGSSEFPVWRKHKTYAWKDNVNATTGAYGTTVNEINSYFDWGLGTPTNSKWQNVSEVTRYTHWSSPVETKDINNNFAASKMADNFSKVVASGNARYSEMYYCGAEHVASGNSFEGEVLGANYRQSVNAHTGNYSVKTNNANDKVFEVSGDVGDNHDDNAKDFRPGSYKVSFWMKHSSIAAANQTGAALKLEGVTQTLSETVEAGFWKQYNYYIDLPASTDGINIHVTNTSAGNYYFDDFRMHPIYASMNSYVYDEDTDELASILDANNIATKYVYDPAGRLCKTYVETMNSTTPAFTGGFKLVSENEYYYKGLPVVDCGDCCSQPLP